MWKIVLLFVVLVCGAAVAQQGQVRPDAVGPPGVVVILASGGQLLARSAELVDGRYHVEGLSGGKMVLGVDQVKEVRPMTPEETKSMTTQQAREEALGQASRQAWLGEQYEYFKDKIACIDGRFYNAVPARYAQALENRRTGHFFGLWLTTWELGQDQPTTAEVTGSVREGMVVLLSTAEIMQVIDAESLLAKSGDTILYLSGLNTTGLVDGRYLPPMALVDVGTHQYPTAIGGSNMVPALRPVGTITREQFVQCLRTIGTLERWYPTLGTCQKCQGSGTVVVSRVPGGSGFPLVVSNPPLVQRCPVCKGTGKAEIWRRSVVSCPDWLLKQAAGTLEKPAG